MPYLHVVQNMDMRAKSREELLRELDFLRTELTDIRTKFGTLLAKLDADVGVTDTNYASTQALATSVFTRT